MANERLTESIVRDHFKEDPLFSSIKIEEQKSTNIRIANCLSKASKSGKNKPGRPEFIVTFPTQNMDYIIVIECKADVNKHKSINGDKPKDYAVDGVLHYANALSTEFDVIAIAVSGEDKNKMVVSNFLHQKGGLQPTEIKDTKLLSIYDYVKLFKNEQLNYNLKDVNIVEKAIKLNNDFHSCSISESMRNTLVSGILLALQDDMFKVAYPVSSTSRDIAITMLASIKRVLEKSLTEDNGKLSANSSRKIKDMMGEYNKINELPLIKDNLIKKKKKDILSIDFFKETIEYIYKQVFPLMSYEESGYDILGRFYTEFVRYAASKQKQGLVLTPSHITELCCDLVEIKVSDIVYDPCCGTGGFLIAAMKKMIGLAGNDNQVKKDIRKNQLLGVEILPEMFTFACSNMMLRGDGKSNIDRGSCFDQDIIQNIKSKQPSVAFLNPPYDQGTDVQLEFVEKALEAVAPQNGKVAAIIQMSCAIKDDSGTLAVRKRLLSNYTLKAVISMPDKLFDPVGVVTCIMVFDTSCPNGNKKTWFGYLKNDGFVTIKNKGRIDHHSEWKDIKNRFLSAYYNNEEIVGLSVKKNVEYSDEWCAEAYMETDYSKITRNDFEAVLRKFAVYKAIGVEENEVDNQ